MEKLVYTNTNGESLVFSNAKPFILSTKDGFSSVENIITSQKNFGQDGETFVSHNLATRNISFGGTIVAQDKSTLLSHRRSLVRVFNPKLAGTLYYENDNGSYEIDVIPEFAPVIGENDLQGFRNMKPYNVTLKALDPYWSDTSLTDGLTPLSTVEPLFSFPLNVTTNYVFATAKSGEIIKVSNDGDIAVGGVFRLKLAVTVVNPKIYNIYTQEFFGFTGTYTSGTFLEISTVRGNKYVRKFTTVWENSMPERTVGSTFLQMDLGDNYLQIQATSGVEGCLGELEFTPKIMGV